MPEVRNMRTCSKCGILIGTKHTVESCLHTQLISARVDLDALEARRSAHHAAECGAATRADAMEALAKRYRRALEDVNKATNPCHTWMQSGEKCGVCRKCILERVLADETSESEKR
jgi:hypothetical protein